MEIARMAANGNSAAMEKLITANLRFVITVALRHQGHGLPLQDLISEGNLGLLQAARHFDPERGCRFITYAVHWIRQAINKAIMEKGRMIRLSCKKAAELAGAARNEAAARSPIDNDVRSLDEPISDFDDLTRKDILTCEYELSAAEKAINTMLREDLESLLYVLEERSAEVIRCRFGLCGNAPMTLNEVGKRYNLSRERVRQIEKLAIKQLEASSGGKKLHAYIA
jgi:RNA polymerase primary sigma factor